MTSKQPHLHNKPLKSLKPVDKAATARCQTNGMIEKFDSLLKFKATQCIECNGVDCSATLSNSFESQKLTLSSTFSDFRTFA